MAAAPLASRARGAGARPRNRDARRPQPARTPRPRHQPHLAPVPATHLAPVPATLPRASRVHPIVYGCIALVIVGVGTFGTVGLNAWSAEASFQARSLEQQIDTLRLEHDDLVAAVALLETPDRVRAAAIGQLGLMEPEQPGFLSVDPTSVHPAEPKPTIPLGR